MNAITPKSKNQRRTRIMTENLDIIASNLTVAFYNGAIRREPFLGDDKRSEFYSPNEENRTPSLSLREVHSVYERFRQMIINENEGRPSL